MIDFTVTSTMDKEKNHFIEISGRDLLRPEEERTTVSFVWTHSPAMLATSINTALKLLMSQIAK